jgi:hypothetical protein
MESCWANNRLAYRRRHGHTSASAPDPTRPKNLYLREDRILAHPPALHIALCIALTGSNPAPNSAPPTAAEAIDHLQAQKITLTYEPETRSLRTDTPREVMIRIDSAH